MKKLLIIILGIFLIGFVFEGIIANKSNVYKEQKVGSIKKNKKLLSKTGLNKKFNRPTFLLSSMTF